MKRTERHHLKEDPLAAWIRDLRESVGSGRAVGTIVMVVLGILALAGAAYGWQQWRAARASELLAAAMVVVQAPVAVDGASDTPTDGYATLSAKLEAALPKLVEAADAYPTLQAGIAARYQAAATLAALGRPTEAAAEYARVEELDGDGLYGRMARLGEADARAAAGEYSQAIALLQAESATTGGTVPVDAVLMQLARVYRLAGQDTEAVTTLTRVVDEFPLSPYRFDAQRELDTLTGGT